MIDLGRIVQTAEHALALLDDVAAAIPGPRGLILKTAIESIRLAFNGAGIQEALKEVQDAASVEAQKIADDWQSEPTKPE